MDNWTPFQVAMVRGVFSALGTGLLVWLQQLQRGSSVRDASIAGGIAALSILALRGGLEGTIDTARQGKG